MSDFQVLIFAGTVLWVLGLAMRMVSAWARSEEGKPE